MMTKRFQVRIAAAALLTLPFWAGGCGKAPEAAAPRPEPVFPVALFAPVSGTPIGVTEARNTVQDGDQVVLRGWIGGRLDPFVENRAVMLLVDESLPLCDEGCKTPWDACCFPAEKTRANTVTVQVADATNQPLRVSLRGQGGLEPAVKVAVAGTVHREGDAVFLVTAERLAVLPADEQAPCASGCAH